MGSSDGSISRCARDICQLKQYYTVRFTDGCCLKRENIVACKGKWECLVVARESVLSAFTVSCYACVTFIYSSHNLDLHITFLCYLAFSKPPRLQEPHQTRACGQSSHILRLSDDFLEVSAAHILHIFCTISTFQLIFVQRASTIVSITARSHFTVSSDSQRLQIICQNSISGANCHLYTRAQSISPQSFTRWIVSSRSFRGLS